MKDLEKHDAGIITVLLDRFENQRLPIALSLQKQVEEGQVLSEIDLMFLKEVSKDINSNTQLFERHPDCKEIATRMMNLCCEITQKGLENES